jgi:hypothetical protein
MASYDRPRDQRIDPAFILATAVATAAALAVAIIAIIFAGSISRVGDTYNAGPTVETVMPSPSTAPVMPPPTTERGPTQVPVP